MSHCCVKLSVCCLSSCVSLAITIATLPAITTYILIWSLICLPHWYPWYWHQLPFPPGIWQCQYRQSLLPSTAESSDERRKQALIVTTSTQDFRTMLLWVYALFDTMPWSCWHNGLVEAIHIAACILTCYLLNCLWRHVYVLCSQSRQFGDIPGIFSPARANGGLQWTYIHSILGRVFGHPSMVL